MDQSKYVKQFLLNNGLTFYMAGWELKLITNYLINEIFTQQRYFRPGFEIGPTDVVVDIGANMGMFALWAAPQAHQGRVICVEPTTVFNYLDMNMALNNLTNVERLNAAIGEDNTELEFVYYPGQTALNHRVGLRPGIGDRLWTKLQQWIRGFTPHTLKAPCISLERLLDERKVSRVSYLKIDCEGGEYEILRTLPSKCFQQIDRLALEFHQMSRDQDYRELVSILKREGYQVEIKTNLRDYYLAGTGEIWAKR